MMPAVPQQGSLQVLCAVITSFARREFSEAVSEQEQRR